MRTPLRVVEDDNVDRVQVYRRRRQSRALLIARNFLLFPRFYFELFKKKRERTQKGLHHSLQLVKIMSTPLSGGYCGGVPPLPIPNREVKPTCADGTAMQCGRVGSRLFSYQSVHLSNQVNAFSFCEYESDNSVYQGEI